MEHRDYKAFIVEGETREPQIIYNLCKIHFMHSNFKIITLPAGQNIYMIWQKLKGDNFDTDIIEVLRENSPELEKMLIDLSRDDFSEIFLFFDYDGHQNNLPAEERLEDVLNEMLETFNNETENGKLYINYPMVEALRDFTPGICGNGGDCYCRIEQFGDYKHISAYRGIYTDFREYTFEVWRELVNVFVMRVSCLFDEVDIMPYEIYYDLVNPHAVYLRQKGYISQGKVFILSAFPEFLLDYFTSRFWNVCIKRSRKPEDRSIC